MGTYFERTMSSLSLVLINFELNLVWINFERTQFRIEFFTNSISNFYELCYDLRVMTYDWTIVRNYNTSIKTQTLWILITQYTKVYIKVHYKYQILYQTPKFSTITVSKVFQIANRSNITKVFKYPKYSKYNLNINRSTEQSPKS